MKYQLNSLFIGNNRATNHVIGSVLNKVLKAQHRFRDTSLKRGSNIPTKASLPTLSSMFSAGDRPLSLEALSEARTRRVMFCWGLFPHIHLFYLQFMVNANQFRKMRNDEESRHNYENSKSIDVQHKKTPQASKWVCLQHKIQQVLFQRMANACLFFLKTVATSYTRTPQLSSVFSYGLKFVSKNIFHIESVVRATLLQD